MGTEASAPNFYMCTAINSGAVARSIRYGVTCRYPVAAAAPALAPSPPTTAR